ncbi:MAG TPA: hypothetical protein VKT82_10650 [Ktedonobacterales bacterium]|nr:hypothetical protein [Ktedonobacterales bacterium]
MSGSQFSYENLEGVYARLNPQQRTTLAQEFLRGFRQTGNSSAEPFLSLNLKKVTPQQLAVMHQVAREKHPDVLGRVMHHPIVSALLGGFGAAELDKYVTGR